MNRPLAVAALGGCLCLLAAALGTPELYVPGIALALVAAGAEVSVRVAARRVELTREPLAATVEEGVSVRMTTLVVGSRTLGRRGELALGEGGALTPRRWLEDDRLRFAVKPVRRGRHVVEPSQLRFRDPFAIAQRTVLSPPTELLVLPRIERIARADLARVSRRADVRRRLAGGAGDIDGVQAARPGVAAARIHWPTVARTGTLVERRVQVELDATPLLVLDTRDPAGADALDMAVRAAGSLAVALARTGGCRVLLADEPYAHRLDAQLTAWPALHALLALVQRGRTLAWPLIEQAPSVVWVSAGGRALARAGGRTTGAGVIVSPFPREGREVLLTVAGCAVQAVDAGERRRAA
jgi:uncharacterized protein (DUF58 family)